MHFRQVWFSIYVAFVSDTLSLRLTEVVKTHNGPVQGEILTNVLSKEYYSAFKGIPYAKPPLGNLRFLPPVDPEPWNDVLPATEHGNVCAQIYGEYLGAEDCLYLNVYTPVINFYQSKEQLKPVFVFIHGGAFIRGHGNSDKFGPDFFLEKDVILITFNYRLGALGFLNLQHPEIPGNAGLKDQSFALLWVQKNIANFGGDPNNVVLSGQSAGSVFVDLHLISNMSRDLFHKSFGMSGSVFNPWAFHTPIAAMRNAYKLGKLINNDTDVTSVDNLVQLLQTSSVETIIKKTSSFLSISDYFKYELPFAPSFENPEISENVFLDECFIEKFKNGDFLNGPHVMGFTNMETAAVITLLQKNMAKMFSALTYSAVPCLKHSNINKRKKRVITSYFKKQTDILFATGIDLKQKYMSQYGNNNVVYYYYTTYQYYKKLIKGTRHDEDLINIFYKPNTKQPLDYFNTTESLVNVHSAAIVRNRVMMMLSNFAIYGDPTPDSESENNFISTKWEKSDESGGFLEIGNELIMHSQKRPIGQNVQKLQKVYEDAYARNVCVPNLKEMLWLSKYCGIENETVFRMNYTTFDHNITNYV